MNGTNQQAVVAPLSSQMKEKPSLYCFVCGAQAKMFNVKSLKKTMSNHSKAPLASLLADTLGYRLDSDKLHSQTLCKSCHDSLDSVDDLQQKLMLVKMGLRTKFLQNINLLDLKYPRNEKSKNCLKCSKDAKINSGRKLENKNITDQESTKGHSSTKAPISKNCSSKCQGLGQGFVHPEYSLSSPSKESVSNPTSNPQLSQSGSLTDSLNAQDLIFNVSVGNMFTTTKSGSDGSIFSSAKTDGSIFNTPKPENSIFSSSKTSVNSIFSPTTFSSNRYLSENFVVNEPFSVLDKTSYSNLIYDNDSTFYSPDERLKVGYSISDSAEETKNFNTFICLYCSSKYESEIRLKMHVRVAHLPVLVTHDFTNTTLPDKIRSRPNYSYDFSESPSPLKNVFNNGNRSSCITNMIIDTSSNIHNLNAYNCPSTSNSDAFNSISGSSAYVEILPTSPLSKVKSLGTSRIGMKLHKVKFKPKCKENTQALSMKNKTEKCLNEKYSSIMYNGSQILESSENIQESTAMGSSNSGISSTELSFNSSTTSLINFIAMSENCGGQISGVQESRDSLHQDVTSNYDEETRMCIDIRRENEQSSTQIIEPPLEIIEVDSPNKRQKKSNLTHMNTANSSIANLNNVNSDLTQINNVNEELSHMNNVNDLPQMNDESSNLAQMNNVNSDLTRLNSVNSDLAQINVNSDITQMSNVNSNITQINNANGDLTQMNNPNGDLAQMNNLNSNLTQLSNLNSNLTQVSNANRDLQLNNVNRDLQLNNVNSDLTQISSTNLMELNDETNKNPNDLLFACILCAYDCKLSNSLQMHFLHTHLI